MKIGVESEKQFKQALADINQSFKVLCREMQLVTSQFDKNDKSAAALTSRNTVLNKEIETPKDKIATLRSALENAASSFGESDKRTQNWQIALNKAEAELNGMERELGDNTNHGSGMRLQIVEDLLRCALAVVHPLAGVVGERLPFICAYHDCRPPCPKT